MEPTPEHPLDTCQAVMIGFATRRFVIVRRDGESGLRPVEARRERVRDLQPGDEVLYRGKKHVIRSLEIYE